MAEQKVRADELTNSDARKQPPFQSILEWRISMFEHDVFISYPHFSNQNDTGRQNGWVSKLHNDLEAKLDELVGRKTSVWIDREMGVGTDFAKAIGTRLGKTRVLLCVLSPAYVNSPWCTRELEEFRRLAAQNGGLEVGEQLRIITVIKAPVDVTRIGLQQALYSNFYDLTEAGAPQQFGQSPGLHRYDQYDLNLNSVAWAITQIIAQMDKDEDAGRRDTSRTIYLAEVTADRNDDRERLAVELRDRKYIVLPEAELPAKTCQPYMDAVRNELNQCFMSIHLLGESLGPVPDKAKGKSIIQIQSEIAAERCSTDSSFKRILWIPGMLADIEENQSAFLDNVREKEADVPGTELIERSFQDLKTRLLQIFNKAPVKKSTDGRIRIYMMFDKGDENSAVPIGQFLASRGFTVFSPAEKKNLSYHKGRLLDCHATLTIYGQAAYEWVVERYDDVVRRVKGWGREKGIPCSAILRTDPETVHKNLLLFDDTKILEPPCYNGLSNKDLERPLNQFISELEQKLGLQIEVEA